MNRKFRPLPADHPLVVDQSKCPACMQSFKAGDETTLVASYPGSPEDEQKAREGKPFNAIAEVFHWDCWQNLQISTF